MRVAVVGLALESVSFLPGQTGLEDFERVALRGPDLVAGLRGTETVGGGFLDVLEAAGAQVLPLVYADAGDAGHAADAAFEAFTEEICHGLRRLNGAVDGLLLFLHGAMTTPSRADPEGELLARVRDVVGPDFPVMAALDLHANLTPGMLSQCTAAFGFHYSPHTDTRETGTRATRCLVATLRGEIAPVMAVAKVPIVLPSIFTATAMPPLADLVAAGFAWESGEARILDVSLFTGFAYADVPQIGATVVAVADGDRAAAQRAVEDLAARLWDQRQTLLHPELVHGLEAGVDKALDLVAGGQRPVVLVEHADRMKDSTHVLRELIRRDRARTAVPYLWDPVAAQRCLEAGMGARLHLDLGGRSSPRAGGPLAVEALVRFVGPKRYVGTGPMRRGRKIDLGVAALVEIGGVLVSVTSNPVAAIDEDPFLQFGLEARDFDIIALRSKTHFRAIYEDIAAEILIVDTPDWGPADLGALPYRNVPTGVFPITARD